MSEDAKELSSLLGSAVRERCKGALAAELRKVETELAKERERMAAENKITKQKEEWTTTTTGTRTYDVQIKNFCKNAHFALLFAQVKFYFTLKAIC